MGKDPHAALTLRKTPRALWARGPARLGLVEMPTPCPTPDSHVSSQRSPRPAFEEHLVLCVCSEDTEV